VVGLARTGIAVADFLLRHGARVTATDAKARGALPVEVLDLERRGARLETGGHHVETFRRASLLVVSPGVPWDLPELQAARASGAEVIAELELACRQISGVVVAVSGTKGKSTTTAAIGAMLQARGGDVRVGGNIGRPAIGLVEGASEATLFVLEVSSFQLEGTELFHPNVAVFLNLSDDHLDRHGSFAAYAAAKARLFGNQTAADWAVVNGADPRALELAAKGRARRVLFGAGTQAPGDAAYFRDGLACLRRGGREEVLFQRDDVRLPGPHLADDLLAAATVARLLGVASAAIRGAARGFEGAEHVLEFVAEIDGLRFFNDSKATNVAAACKSLEAFDRPVIAIMGGRFKGGDLALLAETARGRAKQVLAFGEARARFAEGLAGSVPVELCASLRQAVERALVLGAPGDVVVLAPACSSFDMFEDYAQRGRVFKEEVRRLADARRPQAAGQGRR
jgi:UDP-N-acetylmuramoylalanine--D-glutamate ligase